MNAEPAPPTSAEIDRRLRIVAELRNLCLSLGHARVVAAGQSEEASQTSGHISATITQAHPQLAATILYDPTEPASDDEWP